jgi:hypothetical protein
MLANKVVKPFKNSEICTVELWTCENIMSTTCSKIYSIGHACLSSEPSGHYFTKSLQLLTCLKIYKIGGIVEGIVSACRCSSWIVRSNPASVGIGRVPCRYVHTYIVFLYILYTPSILRAMIGFVKYFY